VRADNKDYINALFKSLKGQIMGGLIANSYIKGVAFHYDSIMKYKTLEVCPHGSTFDDSIEFSHSWMAYPHGSP